MKHRSSKSMTPKEDPIVTTPQKDSEISGKTANPAFYIIFWIASSCVMILFNKSVLAHFPFPFLLTFWHMLCASIVTKILQITSKKYIPKSSTDIITADIYRRNIIPVALCYSISLVMCNQAYIYLSVSYIQMLKAFTPVAVLIISVLFKIEKLYYLELLIITIICIGVGLTSVGELLFSRIGFIYQIVGILAESSRLVLTNTLLRQYKLDPLCNLYFIAPISMFCIGISFLLFEYNSFIRYEHIDIIFTHQFIGIMLLNGIVAFNLNIAVMLLISHTSALTLTLSGIFKDVLLVFLSVVVMKSPITNIQYFGYGIALTGLNIHKEYKKSQEYYGNKFSALFRW